jgi:putative FmdB family regulatory protein
MPLYEYQCNDCGRRTEVLQGFTDPPPAACAECGGTMRRLLSAPAVQFKGTGWYVTDYAGKGKADKPDKGEKAESKDGGDSGKSESSDKSDKSDKKEATAASASTSSSGKKAAGAGE